MTIKFISKDQFDSIQTIYKEHPKLTYENKGFDYLDKKALSEDDTKAFKEVENILKEHIVGFVEFNHFRNRGEEIQLRFQYDYDKDSDSLNKIAFTGVGYIYLSELLNGFKQKT